MPTKKVHLTKKSHIQLPNNKDLAKLTVNYRADQADLFDAESLLEKVAGSLGLAP